MNFETINRFKFEPIERVMHSTVESIRLGRTMVTFNKAMFARMGNPEYLLFGYDAEEKALGVKVVGRDEPNALKVDTSTCGSKRVRNSAYVSSHIAEIMNVDLDEKSILMKRGYKVGDYYVFELRYAEALKKSGRKKSA